MGKRKWTKEKIIAELRRVRKDGPKTDIRIDAAAKRHFGSVRKALQMAGLPCGSSPRHRRGWTKESTLAALIKRQSDGESLDSTHREDPALYAASKRFFGSWKAARSAAGFPVRPWEYYSKDEVLLRIVELYEKELPLTFTSHKDDKLRRSARRYFGSWRKAIESLGLGGEIRRKWTKQKVIDAIYHRRASGECLSTTHREDKGLFCAAVSHFGNWQNAMTAAGIDVKKRERWSDSRMLERLRQLDPEERRNIGRTDNNLAAAIHRRYGTIEKAMREAGIKSPRICWTKARVIEEIESRYSQKGASREEGFGDPVLAKKATKRFGSWAEAIQAAGLSDRIPVTKPSYRWTKEEVLRSIREWHASGKSLEGMDRQYQVLYTSAVRHFRGWRNAVEAAGLQCERRQWSRKVIIQEIRKRLRAGDSIRSSEPANINLAAAAARHFGSWTAALTAASVPAKRLVRKPR